MPKRVLWQSRKGATMVEAIMSFAILALAVPAIVGWTALGAWYDGESRALLHSTAMMQQEMEWLQANCSAKIHNLITAAYDPGRPTSCDNYPNNIAVERPETGVPGMTMTVRINWDEEDNFDVALVVMRTEWRRAYLMSKGGTKAYVGFLYGPREDYWEVHEEWYARSR